MGRADARLGRWHRMWGICSSLMGVETTSPTRGYDSEFLGVSGSAAGGAVAQPGRLPLRCSLPFNVGGLSKPAVP